MSDRYRDECTMNRSIFQFFFLRPGCRIRPLSREALMKLFNRNFGWIPGLRAGVAQLSIAFGTPIRIRRFSALPYLSDRTGRQQTRETLHGQSLGLMDKTTLIAVGCRQVSPPRLVARRAVA